MCIIAAKPAGKKMPALTTIETMWFRNHDGAGFMYAQGGMVHIEKGFMKLSDFTAALNRVRETVDLDSTAVVMHFRIATHGGVIPANTHPFPVTSSVGMLQKLSCTTPLGVAHNGIISSVIPRKGISDTMEYIASQLGPLYKGVPKFYENPHLMEMISNAVDSRLAFMTGAGELYTVGDFVEDEGIMYSNSTYKPYDFSFARYSTKWDNLADGHFNEYDMWSANYELAGTRLLQWLWETGTYVVDSTGRRIDDLHNDYAVDAEGNVYEYKYWDYDAGFVRIPGATARDADNQLVFASYESDAADMEDVFEKVYYDDTPFDTKPKKRAKKKAAKK